MEKRMTELPKSVGTTAAAAETAAGATLLVQRPQSTTAVAANTTTSSFSENHNQASVTDTEKTITSLRHQIEEQRLLRYQDARQVEVKAAKIKDWVTNKLKELEEQNQVLRTQNVKVNQQLELLR